jgi:hypothetical protein
VNPGAVRVVLRLVAVAGIPGVIAGSIADNDAVALCFGALIAVAAFGLILVTSVTASVTSDDAVGVDVEARVARLVAGGADETEVRALVGAAVKLGATRRSGA